MATPRVRVYNKPTTLDEAVAEIELQHNEIVELRRDNTALRDDLTNEQHHVDSLSQEVERLRLLVEGQGFSWQSVWHWLKTH